MAIEANDPIERCTAKQRMALFITLLKGETSVARNGPHGLAVAKVEDWREMRIGPNRWEAILGCQQVLLRIFLLKKGAKEATTTTESFTEFQSQSCYGCHPAIEHAEVKILNSQTA